VECRCFVENAVFRGNETLLQKNANVLRELNTIARECRISQWNTIEHKFCERMQKHENIICLPISNFLHHHVSVGAPYPVYKSEENQIKP